LFFAVKEALNNVRKHAGASEVILRFNLSALHRNGEANSRGDSQTNALFNHHFCICIEDNGHGFAPSETSPLRNGLINMRQRLEQLGGSFALESGPNLGAKVRLTIPL